MTEPTPSPVFFVDTLPADDRREDPKLTETLDRVAAASSRGDFRYTLVTVGDQRRDPWIVAQRAMQANPGFSPLIAINPAYQHPVDAAKRIVSLLEYFPNRMAFNLVTGSFAGEMKAIGDELTFEARCERLREFYAVVRALLLTGKADFEGAYYRVAGSRIRGRPVDREVDFFLSGAFAGKLEPGFPEPHFIRNIRPPGLMEPPPGSRSGLGLGICARASQAEAIQAAKRLFPEDRKGEMLFSLALANNETPWNRWLRPYLEEHPADDPDFYLRPLCSFRSSAPYLVGSYEHVAERLRAYVATGYGFFLIDFPDSEREHVSRCMKQVT